MTLELHHELHAKSSVLSQVILGGQDGLVNVLGVILGVAVASGEIPIILAGGLAATFAESISMGAVAYTSQIAEKDRYVGEKERKRKEIGQNPQKETEEIREIYKKKGFSGTILEEITQHITKDERIWLSTIMREGLGLSPIKTSDVLKAAGVVGTSALVGSLIPLAPFFFFSVKLSLILSLLISAATLFLVGVYKAKKTIGKPLRSGIEIAVIGMGAAAVGYAIGLIFKTY